MQHDEALEFDSSRAHDDGMQTRLLVVVTMAMAMLGCVDGAAPAPSYELPSACANAGRWRVTAVCWGAIEASRVIYIEVAHGSVAVSAMVRVVDQVMVHERVSTDILLDEDGSCRVDLDWGPYQVAVYPHAGNDITGRGSVVVGETAQSCEVTAHREALAPQGSS